VVTVVLFLKLGLDGIEQRSVDDGRLLALQNLALEVDVANVESVAQQIGKRAAGERYAADGLAGL